MICIIVFEELAVEKAATLAKPNPGNPVRKGECAWSSQSQVGLESVVLANFICAYSATRGSRFTIKGTQRSLARLKVRGKEL